MTSLVKTKQAKQSKKIKNKGRKKAQRKLLSKTMTETQALINCLT